MRFTTVRWRCGACPRVVLFVVAWLAVWTCARAGLGTTAAAPTADAAAVELIPLSPLGALPVLMRVLRCPGG